MQYLIRVAHQHQTTLTNVHLQFAQLIHDIVAKPNIAHINDYFHHHRYLLISSILFLDPMLFLSVGM